MSVAISFHREGERVFKRVRIVGQADQRDADLTDADLASPRFKAWVAGKPFGTPIDELVGQPWGSDGGKVTPQMVIEWRAQGVEHVEHLRDLTDNVGGLGMKNMLRKLASDYLAAKAAKVEADAIARREGEMGALKSRVEAIESKLSRVLELLEAKATHGGNDHA